MAARPKSRTRPGGRAARTKAATFAAVSALVAEKGHAGVSMIDIAERAGVAATSLYRRWGDVGALIMAVAVEELMREHPLPNSGSLRGDLRRWARWIAAGLRSPKGSSFFRAFVATALPADSDGAARREALGKRLEQITEMLRRARQRGERTPATADVIDHLLAPLYLRALFGTPADEAFAEALVERLLRKD